MSMFSVIPDCRTIIFKCRVFFLSYVKNAKKDALSIKADIDSPLIEILVKTQALIWAWAVFALTMISRLASLVNNSQITVCIVERFSGANMVTFSRVSVLKAEYLAMHGDLMSRLPFSDAAIANGVPARIRLAPPYVPAVPIQFLESMRRYFRNLSLGEGNFTIVFRWGGHARCSYQRVGFVRHLQCLTTPLYLTGF